MPTESEELITQLWRIGFRPPPEASQSPADIPVERTLWQIVAAKDARLLPGFTILMAQCNARQRPIDVEELIVKSQNSVADRRSMSQMLLLSLQLLQRLNQEIPPDLSALQGHLELAHGDLLDQPGLTLSNGVEVDPQAFRQAVESHLLPAPADPSAQTEPEAAPLSFLERHLKRLFAPKQIELIRKKRNHQPLTKTEREYYSRVVRKKLAAVADRELHETARLIIFGAK